MTDIADGVVYSRSGRTYQAGRPQNAGLVATVLAASMATARGVRAR